VPLRSASNLEWRSTICAALGLAVCLALAGCITTPLENREVTTRVLAVDDRGIGWPFSYQLESNGDRDGDDARYQAALAAVPEDARVHLGFANLPGDAEIGLRSAQIELAIGDREVTRREATRAR
jgi:hypothetical protein